MMKIKIRNFAVILCVIQTFSVCAINFPDCNSWNIMGFYCNGVFVEMNRNRIATWKYEKNKLQMNGKLTLLCQWKNKSYPDYNFHVGASVVQGKRFWLLGGEGTVNNRKCQSVATVMTGTIEPDGRVCDMKAVRSLPFPTRAGRALICDGKIWFLGGSGENKLIFAKILENGELDEWQYGKAYPLPVCRGGFVYYKGCFYANGIAHFALRTGGSKIYAMKIPENGIGKKWVQVESPANALGRLYVHNETLYYFDEISGNIYKTIQEDDGIQLAEWQLAGKMPCPPDTEGVTVEEVPDGWFFFGGAMRRAGKFIGFYQGAFVPFSNLK